VDEPADTPKFPQEAVSHAADPPRELIGPGKAQLDAIELGPGLRIEALLLQQPSVLDWEVHVVVLRVT
jgi:hypothetical protein